MSKPTLRQLFVDGWTKHGLSGGEPQTEYRFHPTRRWRFDIAWPSVMVAVELDGMGYGHQSAGGRRTDNEKQNEAVRLGWRVLRYDSTKLKGAALEDTIRQVVDVIVKDERS